MGVYHQNLRAQDLRRSKFPNQVVFGAADDTAAGTIAGLIAAAVTSQQVSLTKRVSDDLAHNAYPEGTRNSCKVIARSAGGAIQRYNFRNQIDSLPDSAIVALFKGDALAVTEPAVSILPLTAAPYIAGPDEAITVVTVTQVDKTI